MREFSISSGRCGNEPLGKRFFEEATKNGFKAVEILITPAHFRAAPEEICRARKMAADCGVKINSVHCDMEILDPPSLDIFRKAKERLLANLDAARDLGAEILVIHAYVFAPPEIVMVDDDGGLHPGFTVFRGLEDEKSGMLERVQDGMAFYAQEAKKRGVAIALETDTQKNECLMQLIEKADPRYCGICFDTGHAQIQKDAVEFARLLAPRVICTHLHDNDGKKDLHLAPFRGIIDWYRLIRELLRAGYKGDITFESWDDMRLIVAAREKISSILRQKIWK